MFASTASSAVLSRKPAGRRGRLALFLLVVPAIATAFFPAVAGAVTHKAHEVVPSYCAHGGPRLWNNLTVCGWPSQLNTGPELDHCLNRQLVPVGDGTTPIVLSTANAVISCENISGPVIINAANVTITNSIVTTPNGSGGGGSAAITIDTGASATISHVTVNGGNSVHACIWHQGVQMMVDAVNCFGSNDGIFTWGTTGNPPTGGENFTIVNSYFHDFTKATANGHDDGYQTEGTSHGLVSHNTYLMTASSTSAIAIWDSRNDSNDITVSHNLIAGGGFSVYAEDYNPGDSAPGNPSAVGGFSVTNIQFDNNSFSTIVSGCVGKYGVWFTRPSWQPYKGGPTDGWHRLGNVVLETGETIDSANPHNNGQLCS